jgi:hypothetical protein
MASMVSESCNSRARLMLTEPIKRFGILLVFMALSGCGDECSKYSAYTCDQLDKATYNAFFYFPDGREYGLGIAQGLGQCGGMAQSFAASKKMSRDSGWGYVCCLKTKDSECAEKHR